MNAAALSPTPAEIKALSLSRCPGQAERIQGWALFFDFRFEVR